MILPASGKLKKNKSHRGFTLVELLIFIFILGIVATFGVPSLYSAASKSRLSGAATEIILALEYAQLFSMTTGEQTRVAIDDSADTVLLEHYKMTADMFTGSPSTLPEGDVESGAYQNMAHPYNRGSDYLVRFADESRFNGVDVTSASFGGNNYVTFNSTGAPSSGGTVTLMLGDRQANVTVDAVTGKVTSSE